MKSYLLHNLSELAQRRAINIREEALLWDILARDLKREAKCLDDAPVKTRTKLSAPDLPVAKDGSKDEVLFVRIPQAARMMGIGRSSLYKEIAEERLKVRKAGRKTLIAVCDIHAWFENLPDGVGD